MDEKLKILELVRDGKVNPEQGLELLDAIGGSAGNPPQIVENFVELHADKGGARHLRITSLSSKGNKTSFNIPLGVIRFAYSLFPNSLHFTINNRHLDVEELIEKIYRAEKGVVYQDDSENVVFELV
ncbi:MAG: hypothetical protein PHT52_03100 [Eubacteriales bacterium]|nr:hypothetical protein [Eubacteriales bacterium]MDD4078809.1 hypothetical protein [Eubacteriales bacterium]MDD4768750.1 hypothetical protein [Eubacteriales bacterium]